MKNYISINNKQIPLSQEQIEAILAAVRETENVIQNKMMLSDYSPGEIAKIGGIEMVVLEQMGAETALITKDLLDPLTAFSETDNNFAGSLVDDICESFSELLEDSVGADHVVEHEVDLTADDGLKDYGTITRRVSLLTADQYRRYVEILDKYKTDAWWWLATAHSTQRHENARWVKCVSTSGGLYDIRYNFSDCGVRPFCILKSTIFVSR